jgi:hypothetical protein
MKSNLLAENELHYLPKMIKKWFLAENELHYLPKSDKKSGFWQKIDFIIYQKVIKKCFLVNNILLLNIHSDSPFFG